MRTMASGGRVEVSGRRLDTVSLTSSSSSVPLGIWHMVLTGGTWPARNERVSIFVEV